MHTKNWQEYKKEFKNKDLLEKKKALIIGVTIFSVFLLTFLVLT